MTNEWDNESDREVYTDEATGYACLIIRQPVLKSLCGYVGVPEGHKDFKKGYDDVDVSVHGGLTFAGKRWRDGNWAETWWFGFDTAHFGDLVPGMSHYVGDTYKNMAFVEQEIASLAAQLQERNMKADNWNDMIALAKLVQNTPPDRKGYICWALWYHKLMVPRSKIVRLVLWVLSKRRARLVFAAMAENEQRSCYLDIMLAQTVGHILVGHDTEDEQSVGGWSQREIDLFLEVRKA